MTRTRRSSEQVKTDNAAQENNSARNRSMREQRARFEARKKRGGGMSDFNKKLEVDLDLLKEIYPGMAFRWVKDQKGRLTQMWNNGWEFCDLDPRLKIGEASTDGNSDVGGRISVIGGADRDKAEGAYRMYLMMIPTDMWEEIKQMKQAVNDEIDASINRTLEGGGSNPVDRSYQPSREAKYQP